MVCLSDVKTCLDIDFSSLFMIILQKSLQQLTFQLKAGSSWPPPQRRGQPVQLCQSWWCQCGLGGDIEYNGEIRTMPHMTMPRRTPSNSVLSSQRRAITLMMLNAMMLVMFRGRRQILRHLNRGTSGRSPKKKTAFLLDLSKWGGSSCTSFLAHFHKCIFSQLKESISSKL